MARPTYEPEWVSDAAYADRLVRPDATLLGRGWPAGDKPAAQHLNYLIAHHGEWIRHFNTELSTAKEYKRIISAGEFRKASGTTEFDFTGLEQWVITSGDAGGPQLVARTSLPVGAIVTGARVAYGDAGGATSVLIAIARGTPFSYYQEKLTDASYNGNHIVLPAPPATPAWQTITATNSITLGEGELLSIIFPTPAAGGFLLRGVELTYTWPFFSGSILLP